jgi:hypothetical protein
MHQRILSVLFIAAVLLPTATAASGAPAQTEVGQPFPDLVFPTVDGESTVRLSDHRGTRVLLIEFASW